MTAVLGERFVVGLLSLLAAGVFLADVYLYPGLYVPAVVYVVPLLLGAYFLASPRAVAAIAVWTLALQVVAYWLEGAGVALLPVSYVLGLSFMAALSVALASRMSREVALKVRAQYLLQEIDEQRALFQAVVENASTGISVLRGPHFVFELVNPAYQSIAPGKTMLGRTVAEVWPELANEVLPLLEGVFRTGEPYRVADSPLPVQRVPGAPLEEACFTFSYIPMRSGEGQVGAILVLVNETTDQVRARQMVQQRAAELESVLDNMLDGVFVSDSHGRITLVNEAGTQLLGLSERGEAMRPLSELCELSRVRHLDGRPVTHEQQALVRALMGEAVELADFLYRNRQTQRDVIVRVNASPIRNESGEIVGAVEVARDVTELTELERQKDNFIKVAAHELKTPVAVMKGYAQAILRRTGDVSTERRKMLEAIEIGADRIDRIVKDLLDISRLQAGHLELTRAPVDLARLVEQVVDRMSITATKHWLRVVSAEAVVVEGDRDRLEQVVVNLIDNAIRYSPRGGDVVVEVAAQEGRAIVSVSDQGVGIPAERQSGIFQRFYRAHTGTPYDYGGMGVGLYISREIVSRNGGRMWFESEEGRGSTFHFSLPLGGSDGRG